MNVVETGLPGALILEPRTFTDHRGSFREVFHAERYAAAGLPRFVQDNAARSRRDVLRGLHYQWPRPQGKLVFVVDGAVLDVGVDLRAASPTFRRWVAVELSEDNGRQLYLPEGFAHGYLVLSDSAVVVYKCTEVYLPEHDRALRWDDPELAIEWPTTTPILSEKDRSAPTLAQLPDDARP